MTFAKRVVKETRYKQRQGWLMADKVNLKAYFDRIGFAGSIAPTLATLEALHALHPAVIPFENLSPLLGVPVALDQLSLEKKLLIDRRGGYCFEHNTLLQRVLTDLDYTVRPLLARVVWTDETGRDRPPTHMLLLVEISGQSYIADVGFGGLSLSAPLRLRADVDQQTPHEVFKLTQSDGQWTLLVKINDDYKPVYVFTTETVNEETIAAINHEIAFGDGSPFTTELRVALAPPGKRLKLHNTSYAEQVVGEAPVKTELTAWQDIKQVLIADFGLVLPEPDLIDPILARFAPPRPVVDPVTSEA
ncbi:arylamine N-acetyltransferase [Devosia sp. WQ 349]|uniref:arylamine N-acetyltransferase family protein n=1 Tax=Devosia sp. WQ 349K1 TaxID=2800329 RepID=UPI0019032BD3|nr:arylamine N-acetyltransferase [Devosia sp. WQ 349K1]